jgi:REP element-mobilizing transposase RayT
MVFKAFGKSIFIVFYCMGSFKEILYHIILKPHNREKVFIPDQRARLYKYISVLSKNIDSPIYAINVVSDHIHILVSINTSISVSDYIKKIKVSSSIFIKQNNIFPSFRSWASGYSIFTCRTNEKKVITAYIHDQEKHHAKKSYYDKIHDLLEECGYFSSTPR